MTPVLCLQLTLRLLNPLYVNCVPQTLVRRSLYQYVFRFGWDGSKLLLKRDGTRAETRILLSTKRTSPFKSAGSSVQSTTGRRALHIGLQSLYCSCKPVFCSHVMLTGYPLHSLVSPSLLPCVTVCHHISTGLYHCVTTHTKVYKRQSNVMEPPSQAAATCCAVVRFLVEDNWCDSPCPLPEWQTCTVVALHRLRLYSYAPGYGPG